MIRYKTHANTEGNLMARWTDFHRQQYHGVRLDSLVVALKELAGRGLTAGVVLANLHHRRVVPLMERPLRIFEMTEIADPIALVRSRLLPDPFPRAFAATRARCAIDPKSGRCDDKALWELEMLPTGQLVRVVLSFVSNLAGFFKLLTYLRFRLTPAAGEGERCEVRAAHPPLPCARARGATARAGAGGPQEGARDAALGASRAEERGVPAARAARTLLTGDGRVLIIG
jgi:hypothetical protein